MRYETKYSCGDEVFAIGKVQTGKNVPCNFCGGKGKITGANGQLAGCPVCKGKGGEWRPGVGEWRIFPDAPSPIEWVQIEYPPKQVVYRIKNTHREEELCFAAREEAQRECDRLNAELHKQEAERLAAEVKEARP